MFYFPSKTTFHSFITSDFPGRKVALVLDYGKPGFSITDGMPMLT